MKKSLPKTDPSKSVAYIRVSTDEQHLGPEAQRESIERWSSTEGIEVVEWFTDKGTSGSVGHEDRPVVQAALASLQIHSAGILVVSKRDRLARDLVVAALFQRVVESLGARVLSADGVGNLPGPEGALMQGTTDLYAQHERLIIQARTKAALAVKKARGERIGGIPIGFRVGSDGKTLVRDEGERAVLLRASELRREGYSVRKIVSALAEEGFMSHRTGRPFTKGSVELMLRLSCNN